MTQGFRPPPQFDTDSYELIAEGGFPNDGDASDDWGQRVTAVVAKEIRRWRKERGGLSAQQLSERCTAVGYPIPRNVIANLETGRRLTIDVPELLAIAIALNVPPILLLYPVGEVGAVEVAPGRAMTPWNASKWFNAERRPHPDLLGGEPQVGKRTAFREWEKAAEVFAIFRRHDFFVRRYRLIRDDTVAELRRMAETSPEHTVERDTRAITDGLARDLAAALDALRRYRLDMKELGYDPPGLPTDIDLHDDL